MIPALDKTRDKAIIGKMEGRVIYIICLNLFAPSIIADSYDSGFIEAIAAK